MNHIDYKTPDDFRSTFTPVLGFSNDVLRKVNDFIANKVNEFLRLMDTSPDSAEFIQISDTITEKEFKNTSTELANSYFYELIFTDPEKMRDGSIGHTIKYCITFDRDLTPFSKNNFNYGFIKIANRPVLYYILFDLQELIRISKQ